MLGICATRNLACCILTVMAVQRIIVGYTDNPSAEVNDIMRDHAHMEARYKDLFYSLRIVSEATDPTHPHAIKTLCLSGVPHALLGAQFDQYLLLHAKPLFCHLLCKLLCKLHGPLSTAK